MEPRKTIAFYGMKTFPSHGGTDRVGENIINQLKDKYRFVLCCYKDPEAATYMPGIEVIQFRQWGTRARSVFLYYFISAIYLMFRRDIDLIHAHKTDCAFFLPLLRLRYKIVTTSHEAPYKRDKWGRVARLYFHVVERMFISFSDVSTCISMPLTEYYNARYNKNVMFIPNGINLSLEDNYIRDETMELIRQKYFHNNSDYILFAARRIMSTKGCHTFLEAIRKINYKGNVVIAGELVHNREYIRLLKRLAFGLDVHFVGFIGSLSDLLTLVHYSKVFVFPSETEGMSIMLLEVASVGTPIIASDIPENKQVFNESEVLYFKTGDSGDLATKLEFALSHPENMKKFGVNCQQRVLSNYLWANIAVAYSSVYESLLPSQKEEFTATSVA